MRLFISSLTNQQGSTPISDIRFSSEISVNITNHFRSGVYTLGMTCLYYNGNYYGTGQSTVDTGERGIIWKWNPDTEVFTHDEIYGVFSGSEEIQHRFPSFAFDDDGYIYACATDAHVSTVRVYKSTNPEDITSFSEVSNTGGNNGYPSIFIDGNIVRIYSRETGSANPFKFYGKISTSVKDSWSWSFTDINENTDTGARNVFYNYRARQEIGNAWIYLLGGARSGDGGTEEYHQQCIFKTQDWETFVNIEETFSKNVVIDGAITEVERTNYVIRDNGADKGVGIQRASIVNDVYVDYYYDWDASIHYMQWFDGSWNTAPIPFDLLYSYDGGVNGVYKIGGKYYIHTQDLSNCMAIYESEIPFTTFTKVLDLGCGDFTTGTSRRLTSVFPGNVTAKQKSILIGSRGLGTLATGGYDPTPIDYNIVTFE